MYIYIGVVWTIGVVVRMSIFDTKVAGSNLSINMFSPWARDFIRIASVDSAVKWVPGGDNLVKGVQCYELFGGIALRNHTFSFFIFIYICRVRMHIYIYIVKVTFSSARCDTVFHIRRWRALRLRYWAFCFRWIHSS